MDYPPRPRQGEVDARVKHVRVRNKATEPVPLLLPLEPPSMKRRPELAKEVRG